MKHNPARSLGKCQPGCTCRRHDQTGPRPKMRTPADLNRLRELAPLMSQQEIADQLGVSRHVVQARMKELGIEGRPQSMTRVAKHRRLHKVRGKASAHPCVRCNRQARDWAQIHSEDGTDPWADYVPLCRACHLRYDRDARLNPGSLAKWRASAGPAIAAAWTPERREAQSGYAKQTRKKHPIIRDPDTGRIIGIA